MNVNKVPVGRRGGLIGNLPVNCCPTCASWSVGFPLDERAGFDAIDSNILEMQLEVAYEFFQGWPE